MGLMTRFRSYKARRQVRQVQRIRQKAVYESAKEKALLKAIPKVAAQAGREEAARRYGKQSGTLDKINRVAQNIKKTKQTGRNLQDAVFGSKKKGSSFWDHPH